MKKPRRHAIGILASVDDRLVKFLAFGVNVQTPVNGSTVWCCSESYRKHLASDHGSTRRIEIQNSSILKYHTRVSPHNYCRHIALQSNVASIQQSD